MKFEREYLLKAGLREEIDRCVSFMGIGVSKEKRKRLADMIFYRLLHAGELKEDPVTTGDDYRKRIELIRREYIGDKKDEIRMIDVTGLTREEACAKTNKAMEEWRKEAEGSSVDVVELKSKTIHFKVKGLKMKVDKDSPFRGTLI